MDDNDQKAYDMVRKLFKNDYGEPFEMTAGQIALFRAIYEKQSPRTQFDCYTQYGKSDVVSMAVLMRAATFPDKWIILGATKDKASIIMSKLIKHIFENDYTLGKFEVNDDESLDFIRRNRAKDNITFKVDEKNIGQVITLSADARRKSADAGDILIGHGGQNLIEDDAALIPDQIHGKALRMLGGHKDNFLLKITNSFGRNHAYRSRIDPKFTKHIIDYKQGLAEGRLTEEYMDEMKKILDPVMFGILYECVYPPAEMMEDGGWMVLLTEEQIKQAEARYGMIQSKGFKKLGVDVAEGVNYNAYVIRTDNVMRVKKKTQERDLMKTADDVNAVMSEEHISPASVFMDIVMIGSGVFARLNQMGVKINGVKAGAKPTEKTPAQKEKDPIDFYNLRAEMFWKFRQWILEGGALEPHADWMQLTKIRFKEASNKTIQIMPKEQMHALGYLSATESPDTADAGSLTFAPSSIVVMSNQASPALQPFYPELGF